MRGRFDLIYDKWADCFVLDSNGHRMLLQPGQEAVGIVQFFGMHWSEISAIDNLICLDDVVKARRVHYHVA